MYIQVRTHRLSTNTCVYSYAHTQALQIYRHMKNEQRKKEELKFEINTLHALAYHTVVVALGLTSIVLYRLKNILIPKSSEPPESQQFSTAIDTRSASLYCTKITIYVLFFFFYPTSAMVSLGHRLHWVWIQIQVLTRGRTMRVFQKGRVERRRPSLE